MDTDPNVEEASDTLWRVVWLMAIGVTVVAVVVLVVLSFVIAEEESGLPDPPVSMAEVREAAATIRAQWPGPTQEPVGLGEIKEESGPGSLR